MPPKCMFWIPSSVFTIVELSSVGTSEPFMLRFEGLMLKLMLQHNIEKQY